MKRALLLLLVCLACLAAGDSLGVSAPGTALPPPSTGGLSLLDSMVAKLATHRRLLVVGAHPDDEDTELLALGRAGHGRRGGLPLALSRRRRTEPRSAPDLGVGLGLVRSQELCAARRLDGARQFFTRAYDFGFTRSLDGDASGSGRAGGPARGRGAHHAALPAAGRLSVFSGTARDGHGQHQARALTAREAYRPRRATRPRFPQLAAEGPDPLAADGALPGDPVLRPRGHDGRPSDRAASIR